MMPFLAFYTKNVKKASLDQCLECAALNAGQNIQHLTLYGVVTIVSLLLLTLFLKGVIAPVPPLPP